LKPDSVIALAIVLHMACAAPVLAQNADVTFFVIGKHANFSQDASGERKSIDYSFFSEVFLTADGDASNAVLTLPTGERLDFRDMRERDDGSRDNILLVSGEDRFTKLAGLQARYPDGKFIVSFSTPSGDVDSVVLEFDNRGLPTPPKVSIAQNGVSNCVGLMPGVNATVSWGAFDGGRADPNGILDDLIFVILTDAEGNRVAHSGRPFEGKPYLTFATETYTIDGAALQPGQTYVLSVEHAILDDTTRFDSVPAFTTRASTTKIDIATFGDASERTSCTARQEIPSLDSQVTMLYYKNFDDAVHFYGSSLGLEMEFDWPWIKFFKTGPSSSVGIVAEGEGAWHKAQETNAVMLSLVTSEVDAWNDRLNNRDDVIFLKEIGDSGGIRSFMLQDPGGYTVEFFEWL